MTPNKQAEAVNGAVADDVLTLAEAAAYLKMSESAALEAATARDMPGQQTADGWRFSRSALQRWLGSKRPLNLEEQKASLLALAGVWKDDPDIEQIVEDAMRRRGREPGPDGKYGGYRPSDGSGE